MKNEERQEILRDLEAIERQKAQLEARLAALNAQVEEHKKDQSDQYTGTENGLEEESKLVASTETQTIEQGTVTPPPVHVVDKSKHVSLEVPTFSQKLTEQHAGNLDDELKDTLAETALQESEQDSEILGDNLESQPEAKRPKAAARFQRLDRNGITAKVESRSGHNVASFQPIVKDEAMRAQERAQKQMRFAFAQRLALPLVFAAMILIGMVWLFNVLNQAGLLAEPVKIGFFYLASLALFGGTFRSIRTSILRQTLLGVALAAGLLTTFTATAVYQLFPLLLGAGLGIAWIVLGCWTSAREHYPILAGLLALVSFFMTALLLRQGSPIWTILIYVTVTVSLLSLYNRVYQFPWSQLATLLGLNITILSLVFQNFIQGFTISWIFALLLLSQLCSYWVGNRGAFVEKLAYSVAFAFTVVTSTLAIWAVDFQWVACGMLLIGFPLVFLLFAKQSQWVRTSWGLGMLVSWLVTWGKLAQAFDVSLTLNLSGAVWLLVLGALLAYACSAQTVVFGSQLCLAIVGTMIPETNGWMQGQVLLAIVISGAFLFQERMRQDSRTSLWLKGYWTVGYLLALSYVYSQVSHILLFEIILLLSLWAIQVIFAKTSGYWFSWVDLLLKALLIVHFAWNIRRVSSAQEILQFYYILLIYLLIHGFAALYQQKRRLFAFDLVIGGLGYLSLLVATDDAFMPFFYMLCATLCWLAYSTFSEFAGRTDERLATSWFIGLFFGYVLAFRQFSAGFTWTLLVLTLLLLAFAQRLKWQTAFHPAVLRIGLCGLLGFQFFSFLFLWRAVSQNILGIVLVLLSMLLYFWVGMLGEQSQMLGNWWRPEGWFVVVLGLALGVGRIATIGGAPLNFSRVLVSAALFLCGFLFLWLANEKRWPRFDIYGTVLLILSLMKMLLVDLIQVSLVVRGVLFLVLGILGFVLLVALQKRHGRE